MLYGGDLKSRIIGVKADDEKQSKTCQTETVEGCSFPMTEIHKSSQATQTSITWCFPSKITKQTLTVGSRSFNPRGLISHQRHSDPKTLGATRRAMTMTPCDSCPKRLLFIGKNLTKNQTILHVFFNSSISSSLKEGTLSKVDSSLNDIELYVGLVSTKTAQNGIFELMKESYNFRPNVFNSCFIFGMEIIEESCAFFNIYFFSEHVMSIVSRSTKQRDYGVFKPRLHVLDWNDLIINKETSESYRVLFEKLIIGKFRNTTFTFDKTIVNEFFRPLLCKLKMNEPSQTTKNVEPSSVRKPSTVSQLVSQSLLPAYKSLFIQNTLVKKQSDTEKGNASKPQLDNK